jgi:signal transduction histidine kinase
MTVNGLRLAPFAMSQRLEIRSGPNVRTEKPSCIRPFLLQAGDSVHEDSPLWVRADERRRVARELHDSTSQLLVVIHLHLARLRRNGSPELDAAVGECDQTIADIREQIRSLTVETR